MIGRNFSVNAQRAKYAITDFVMISLSFLVFNIYRFYALNISGYDLAGFLCNQKLIVEQIIVPVCLMGVLWLSGYYNRPFNKSRVEEFNVTFWSVFASTLLIYLILLINDSTGFKSRDYAVLLTLFLIMFGTIYSGRLINTGLVISNLRKRHWIYRTLIIGNSQSSRETYRRLTEAGSIWAYDVIGFIRLPREHDVEDGMQVWPIDRLEEVCRNYSIDQIILNPEVSRDSQIMAILDRLFPLGIPVKIAPDTLSYVTANIRLNDILGIPFIDLTSPRISEFQKNVKRSFDVAASVVGLLILSPVLAVTAFLVKKGSRGPVIYRQERIGKGYKPFTIYKFRSMYEDAEANGPCLSNDGDNRITPFGRIMRKYRLDELPQFWNVIKGDMSLVGPRPEREYFIGQIIKKAPYYGLIFQVRPGITSWGMVKYGYASSIQEMVGRSKYDLIYLNNMSISNDIKIMIYTIRTVLKGVGV